MGEKTFSEQEIYAVDFDGTLCENQWPEIGLPNEGLIDYLKQKRSEGAYLILWTCRVENLLEDAIRWCAKLGLYFDAVNENSPYAKAKFGGDSRKIYADHYIDDKNLYAVKAFKFSVDAPAIYFPWHSKKQPTFRDLAKIDSPSWVDTEFTGGVWGCPHSLQWEYEETAGCPRREWSGSLDDRCAACWDRPVPEELLEQRRKEGKRCY